MKKKKKPFNFIAKGNKSCCRIIFDMKKELDSSSFFHFQLFFIAAKIVVGIRLAGKNEMNNIMLCNYIIT